jgi:hypothetical protein
MPVLCHIVKESRPPPQIELVWVTERRVSMARAPMTCGTHADAQKWTSIDALWIVGGLALLRLVLHLVANGGYGLHRDEAALFDYAGRLAWGYVEFPPLTPFLVRSSMEIFGATLWGARVLSALAQSLVVLLAGLIARDLGGGRAAQILAAVGAWAALFGMLMGSMTLYASFDYLWWVAIAWAMVRRVCSGNPRWWLLVGLFVGLGMLTKYTMALFGASILGATLLSDLRRDLRGPWPWLAAAMALLILAPNLIWQAQHGWVAIEFTRAIHARDVAWGRSEGYWLEQLYANASPLALPLWIAGLVWLLAARDARPYRFLAWLYLLPLLAFGLLQGRAYYVAAPTIWLVAAGAVVWEMAIDRLPGMWRRAAIWATGALAAVAVVGAVFISTPVAPVNSALWRLSSSLHDTFREQLIWPELTETVAGVYHSLPFEERADTTIITGNYGEAGAINWFGKTLGLPRAISGTNTYWLWGYGDPANPPTHVIAVGIPPDDLRAHLSGCALAATVPNPQDIQNEETRWHRSVWYCAGVRTPWETLWPLTRNYG